MTVLRSVFYLVWFYGGSILLCLLWLPALLLPRKATLYGMRLWSWMAISSLRLICGVKTEIRGRENLPDEPALIASKHHSLYDIIVAFRYLNDPAFVLKRELLIYPLFGWYAMKSAQIPINRDGGVKALKSMNARARKLNRNGREILVYPEGTRQPPGSPPDYKPGVALLYKDLDLPCVPIATNAALCWPGRGIVRKPGTVIYEILPVIERGEKRQVFMSHLQADIETKTDELLAEGREVQKALV